MSKVFWGIASAIVALGFIGQIFHFLNVLFQDGLSAASKAAPGGGAILGLILIIIYLFAIPELFKNGHKGIATVMLLIALAIVGGSLLGRCDGNHEIPDYDYRYNRQ